MKQLKRWRCRMSTIQEIRDALGHRRQARGDRIRPPTLRGFLDDVSPHSDGASVTEPRWPDFRHVSRSHLQRLLLQIVTDPDIGRTRDYNGNTISSYVISEYELKKHVLTSRSMVVTLGSVAVWHIQKTSSGQMYVDTTNQGLVEYARINNLLSSMQARILTSRLNSQNTDEYSLS